MKNLLRTICTISFAIVLLASSCDEDDYVDVTIDIEKKECEVNRKTVEVFDNATGEIRKSELTELFFIVSDYKSENPRLLWACNLPDELMENDIIVRFSGDLLETFPLETLAAHPFELSKVSRKID